MKLSTRIDEIIRKYRIDAIFGYENNWLTLNEALEQCRSDIADYILKRWDGCQVVIYPGGSMGRAIARILKETSVEVKYILDNCRNGYDYNGIPVIGYEEWKGFDTDDCIILAKADERDAFINQLILDGYGERYFDAKEWMEDKYKNMGVFTGSKSIPWSINSINLLIEEYEAKRDPGCLKAIILGLMKLYDFSYAEKYVEYLRDESETYRLYRVALDEIISEMEKAVNDNIHNIVYVHIIDSLENSMVDAIPWLHNKAKKGLRFTKIAAQYTFTEYCINRLFTGKDVFDIEVNGKAINDGESELLKYIQNNFFMTVVSGDSHIRALFSNLKNVESVESKMAMSSILFHGIEAMQEHDDDQLVLLHSVGEIHSPFLSIGKKCYEEKNTKSRKQFYDQAARGYDYVNEQLIWYERFFNLPNSINLFMGDHGIWTEAVVDYNLGIKKDLPFLNMNESTPALVIVGNEIEHDEIDSLISSGSLNEMLLELLSQKRIDSGKYKTDLVTLQQIPIYNPQMAERFIQKGAFAQYEGLVGIRTEKEIYLCSASEKEMYFRPEESGYRNLINHERFADRIWTLREIVNRKDDMYRIYSMNKYKEHLEILEKYAPEDYLRIKNRIKEL